MSKVATVLIVAARLEFYEKFIRLRKINSDIRIRTGVLRVIKGRLFIFNVAYAEYVLALLYIQFAVLREEEVAHLAE